MRLRFRGPCWDDGEASASALPTAVTLSTPRCGRPSNPLQSLRNFLQSEGRLAPRSPIGLLGSRVPPSTDLASWSCAAAIKQGWAMQERDQPGSEEQGRDDKATPAGCALQSGNTIKSSLPVELGDIAAKYPQHHSPTQPLPASPTCCVIVSDPTSALTPEFSFPKVMLTDRVHREALFSVTQSMLSTTMGLPWPTASSSKSAQGRKAVIAPADRVGAGICLLELVASHEGKALEPPCPPTVKLAQGRAETQLQQHFEAITLDLDEDASVLLRKSFPGIGSSTSTRHLDNGDAGDTYGSSPLNKHHSTLNTECPAPPSVWRALDLVRLLEARPIEQRRRRSAVMDRSVLPWESYREQWSTRIEFSPESGKQPDKPSSRGCCDRVASEAEGGTAAVFGMVGQTSSSLPDVVGRGFDVFTSRTSMPGPNCDEELRLHDPSPPKRVGLLHLLGNVCRETPLVAADRLRFHQLADEHDRPGFEPVSSLSVNAGPRSLFPGCSPSIPMTNVVGGPRSGRGRQPPQELGLGSRQNHRLGLEIGGDNGSRQRKKSLLVLARLFAELRKMRHTTPGRVSTQQSLLQELPPHRQLAAARQGQYINALFGDNPVSTALSMGNTTKPHESVTASTDKLLDDILASWRETHAPLPAGNAQGPQQQDPPNHPKVDRARRALPPSPPAAMPAASCQRSQPGTKTPLPSHVGPNPLREQAHDNPIMNAVRSPQDAPPYEGTPRRSDEPVQGGLISLRPIGEVLGDVEPSSQQLHRGSKVVAQEEGGGGVGDGVSTTAKSEAAHAKQVAVRAAVKAAEHGNSAVSKRKLGEVMWGFGATPSRAKGRTSPPPAPMAVGSTSDSAGRTATSGGGCALVSHGYSLGSGESLTVGGGSGGNAGAAGNTAPAEALGSLFVAARHPHQQAATKAGGGMHTQSNHRAQGGGDDPRAVAVATTAASGLPSTSQRPQVSEESCITIVSDTPEFVKDSHRSGEIRSVGLGSRDKTTRKRVVGNSAGAHLSQPKYPSNGALVSEQNHAHSPRGAVLECDQVSTGSARSPARHAVSSPSVQQGGTTTARPDANGSRRLVSSTERDNRSHRPTSVGPAHLVSTGTAISSMSAMVRQEGLPSGRGAKQEREEDAAMAGCESARQREILALIRAGSVGETFLLSRGRHSTSGAAGKKRQLDSTATGTKTPRRHSEPSGGGAINSFSASTYRDGVSLRSTTSSAVGKQFDRPLYAVVSEDFVSGAGSMVRTLSAPRATPGAISTSRVAQEPIAFRSERPEVAIAATATAARAAAAVSRFGGRFHLLELPVEHPVNMVIGNRSAVVILDNRRRESRAATSEGVAAARKASRGDRWGGEGDAIVSPGGDNGGGSSDGADGGAAAASAEEAAAAEEEAEAAEAKEKLRLLQLQSLKYSTLWLIVQMEKVRVGAPADESDGGGGTRLRPALKKLEQWLVGFPCRVLIRHVYETQLAELITHAATTEQQQQQPRRKTNGVGATSVAITGAGDSSAQGPGGKRQRLDAGVSPGTEAPSEGSVSRNAAAGAGVRSPLEAVDERSRADSDWAGMHDRQAWFLQLFPALNAFSASALLSCASLKHLIVAPYDELAPGLLGRSGGGDYAPGTDGRSSSGVGAARGGVKAECLLDFCSAVRLEEEQGNG
ncbi:unnamed protein product [Ectocarpus sp. 6 AP-2014]